MKKLLAVVIFVLLLGSVSPVWAHQPIGPTYKISGGINTVEGFYQAEENKTLDVLTGYKYDVVATAYTSDPGLEATIHLYGVGSENVPYVTYGQLLSSSYDGEKWIIKINPDENGTVEVVVHMPWPLNPDHITYGIYPGYGSSQQFNYWRATIRTHQVFLPLVIK